MNNLQQWMGVRFVSSPSVTAQFARFARAYKKALIAALGQDFALLSWSRGHFYVSAFFRNRQTGKVCYLACSDVRFFPNAWYERLLIREARDKRDFTGGANHFVPLERLPDEALRLTAGA